MADRSAAYREALAGLREELAELEQRATKVRTSIDVIADLVGESEAVADASIRRAVELAPAAPVASDSETPSFPTISEAARIVIRETGRHMRALQITEGIRERGLARPDINVADLRASVGSILAKNARKGRIFTKPAKGLFGLLEWLDARGPNETEDDLLRMMLDEDDGEDDDGEDLTDEQKEAAGG